MDFLDFIRKVAQERRERYIEKHYGPGPHRGTGTSQSIHAGARQRKGTPKGAHTGERKGQGARKLGRREVIDHIMKDNPPEQVKSGKMTADEWAEKYLSNEQGGYVLTEVAPDVLHLPAQVIETKVKRFVEKKGTPPAIVIDSNQKLEARFGGGKLERAYGRCPDIVIDGKHRVKAAMKRGDVSIKAIVPISRLNDIRKRSHDAELDRFAMDYFKDKEYPFRGKSSRGWQAQRQGKIKTWTPRDIKMIARNLKHTWLFEE